MKNKDSQKLIAWLVGNDTGISSKQIAAVMAGVEPRDLYHAPSDPSDLGRCFRLLELFPDFDVWEMRAVNTKWWHLVNRWGELLALWREESPTGSCPKLYKLMQELQALKPNPDNHE
jgi:hypothetical protein